MGFEGTLLPVPEEDAGDVVGCQGGGAMDAGHRHSSAMVVV